mgnify:CR=1 FL=1
MEIEKLDIDSIFVKYTINEIRDIEEKIKVDMERKKEELRSMVGYEMIFFNELDAIFEMKTCAKGVCICFFFENWQLKSALYSRSKNMYIYSMKSAVKSIRHCQHN